MRLRDLFRGPSNNERKVTTTISPVLDINTFLNAVHDKDMDTLQKCLIAGFPPDQPDPITKATALHIAAETANIRAVHMLLQAGAQVNVCDSSLSTPLHIAAYMGYDEIVQILLMHGADIFIRDNTGRNAFHLAVSTGNNRLVQHFLSTTDNEHYLVHIPDAENWTPLMCACASNHSSTCTLLLSHGAYLGAVNDRGMTVLHITAFLGSLPVIYELLNSSSLDDDIILKVINQGDNRNQTPLFYACNEGHLDIALILLYAGANIYHLDNDNQTCLHAMLSSSIILKRHIRLFYRLIELVDFRYHQDYLSRTLLDLAYLNQLNTIIYLLKLLNYKRNYTIISNNDYYDNFPPKVLTLRQICILKFKQSIIYNKTKKQSTQHDLLENALQQCFQINQNDNMNFNDLFHRESLEDISMSNKKNSKSTKKSHKKISNVNSSIQNDIEQQHTQSSWSIFTNKFKYQRTTSTQPETPILSTSLPQTSLSTNNNQHPMRNLALMILKSSTKLDDLLDFPSLTNSIRLYEDMKTIMITYNLEGIDSSNEI